MQRQRRELAAQTWKDAFEAPEGGVSRKMGAWGNRRNARSGEGMPGHGEWRQSRRGADFEGHVGTPPLESRAKIGEAIECEMSA
jgi:hypothetical protein